MRSKGIFSNCFPNRKDAETVENCKNTTAKATILCYGVVKATLDVYFEHPLRIPVTATLASERNSQKYETSKKCFSPVTTTFGVNLP